jgi:hypothetical protein
MTKSIVSGLLVFFFLFSVIKPCTTAVVSGKATDDGRPLLLKNRDADALQNRLVYFFDGKYKFIGLVNSDDKDNKEVWCGFNSTGFGIMNSASYNLKLDDDTTKLSDLEGKIMKMALESCATLEDFEKMLNELPKPLGVEANFGVIDANGGAAYYETDNFHFIKYDVNDPSVAPNGYLIRTNFSVAGLENKGYGYIRYATASELFENKIKDGKISFEFLINDVPRCLIHSFTKTDLAQNLPEENSEKFVYFRDYIPRHSTSAAIVVQGVKENESASLTTMWTILGFPLTSVVIPVWLLEDGTLPKVLQADEKGNAPFCDLALKLKDNVFSNQNDASENYLNLSALINQEKTGVRQKIIPIEEKVLVKSKSLLNKWRSIGIDQSEVKKFYEWVDNDLYLQIKNNFSIK